MTKLKAPFPYFGGKSAIAAQVWQYLDQPKHYLEPFFGSGAVLLARPNYQPAKHIESVVDKDGFVCNVWRALQFAPDEVAKWCDWPVNHTDLAARRLTLIRNEERLLENLIIDEKWFDPVMAGYWIWAASCWIGRELTCIGQRPHLADGGKGVHTLGQRPHITDGGMGVHVTSLRPDIDSNNEKVQDPYNMNIYQWFRSLSERLRYVRVVCGDWTRVCGGNWQDKQGDVGIFFDPPYSGGIGRDENLYHQEDLSVAAAVRQWCLDRGEKSSYRIVLAGYADEHYELIDRGWRIHQWKTQGGYGNAATKSAHKDGRSNVNRHRECLFISPHCKFQGLGII